MEFGNTRFDSSRKKQSYGKLTVVSRVDIMQGKQRLEKYGIVGYGGRQQQKM